MQELNLPYYRARMQKKDGKMQIFDDWRKRYVALTPEEWVRQCFLHFLVDYLNYPAGRISSEQTVMVNDMNKRADAVVYDTAGQPYILIEFKSPDVPLKQKVFDQAAVYCRQLGVQLFFISNGIEHYACRIDRRQQQFVFLERIPQYEMLNAK